VELLNCVYDTTSCNWRMGDCAERGGFNRTETRLLQIEGPPAAGMQ
jgi:hypothetical protein